jgi:PhnB protein
MTQHARPDGYSWMIPTLTVVDADAGINFYTKAFGFHLKDKSAGHEDGKTTVHAELTYKDQTIFVWKSGEFDSQVKTPKEIGLDMPFRLYLYSDDVDKLYKHATAAGATSHQEPQNMFWGDRMCVLSDPDGHIWCFATRVGECKPE